MSGGLCKAVSDQATKEKTDQKLDVVLDIQSIIAKNKGPIYEQWAKRHNIKAISKTLIFLSERGLESYKKLTAVATEATEKFDSITSRQKELDCFFKKTAVKRYMAYFTYYISSEECFKCSA